MKILRQNTNEIVKIDSTHFSTLHNVETIKPLASITHQLIQLQSRQITFTVIWLKLNVPDVMTIK